MRHLATLSLLVAAGNAAAYNVSYTLSLDVATGNTRVEYAIGGDYASQGGQLMDNSPYTLASFNSMGTSVSPAQSVPTPGTPGWSGSLSGPSELLTFVGDSPAVTAVNVETNVTRNAVGFVLMSFGSNLNLGLSFGEALNGLPISNGQHLRISGDTSGSFVINKSFSFFNQGQWTNSPYSNVVIGSAPAVPEPSTYGLALGGLALAVVAARRRKASK